MTFMARRRANPPGITTADVLLSMPLCARSQQVATIYGGKSDSHDSDVQLTQPGNTRLTFHDVSWGDRSLDIPVYSGVCLTYWLLHARVLGIAADLSHAEIRAEPDTTEND